MHLDRKTGEIKHRQFREVLDLLIEGDLLVLNDTRVSAVRLFGEKPTGGAVEALLLKEEEPGVYEALLRPGKRLKPGQQIQFEGGLEAQVTTDLDEGRKLLTFKQSDDLREKIAAFGLAPLPPYIHEKLADKERYQTVYGTAAGSAAAPTAGLHFTPEILAALEAKGVRTSKVTLHVGLDTFRPVQTDDPAQHPIHGETCDLSQKTASNIAVSSGRIIAVGTTTVRTLESFAKGRRSVDPGSKTSRLFIRPGFDFKIVDGMFTNFHMPRTTMMMMISALAGRENVMKAYEEAVAEGYRFLSFGDSMLIL